MRFRAAALDRSEALGTLELAYRQREWRAQPLRRILRPLPPASRT